MVYTVTFNPAVDYIIHLKEELQDGETNRSSGEELYYGGKGINVSTVLHNLGINTVALGFIAGFTGRQIQAALCGMGISNDFIDLEDGFSRINIKLKAQKETEINTQGPKISAEAIDRLFKKLADIKDGDVLVLAGSIPASLPPDIYEKIMERLSGRDIRIIVDATGQLLVNVLKYRPFLIKPNSHELEEIFGVKMESTAQIIEYAKKLRDMGAANVLVSMAGDGAILVTEHGDVHQNGVPEGKVVNSVGAGDSMVAGFIAGFMKCGDYLEALRTGTAAGSATAFSKGLAQKVDVERLLNQI